ncbi:uncharacterized protein [Hyperolius riggenbachi]|uniref:uncharacterized protein n=1 Tax=Hyperolius riggenbachi TaxID=752182 RepID=UPI0035A304A5
MRRSFTMGEREENLSEQDSDKEVQESKVTRYLFNPDETSELLKAIYDSEQITETVEEVSVQDTIYKGLQAPATRVFPVHKSEWFDDLLEFLFDDLKRADTTFRQAVSPTERLLLTLRFLASGHSYSSLHLEFRLGKSTIQGIVLSTCTLLWRKLQPIYMMFPDESKWMQVADLFWRRCNFPHCIGAIDGKHVRVVCPPCSGSRYFNYKKYFSLVLLAIVDADYKFLYVDIGSYGSSSDSTIFKNSKFGRLLESGRLDMPNPLPWPGQLEPNRPFCLVGDEAFGLSTFIMRPYAQRGLNTTKRTFNYRLSRARRMVECAFGIMAAKWRIFQGSLQMTPEHAVTVIKAACILHNYVREKEGVNLDDSDTPIVMAPHRAAIRASGDALRLRDELANYILTCVNYLWRNWYKR